MSERNQAQHEKAAQIIEALLRFTTHLAHLTGRYLQQVGLAPTRRQPQPTIVPLPAEALLELGGILQIAQWERGGLRELIPLDLPSAAELLVSLHLRLQNDPGSFRQSTTARSLAGQVMTAWFIHCARDSRAELGIDTVVQGAWEESVLEDIADLLWQHRDLGTSGDNRNE